MTTKPTCLLCGDSSGEVTVRLVEWREPIGNRIYEHLPRCVRVDDCWVRVTALEDWPVNDGRAARPLSAPTVPEPIAESPTALGDPPTEDPAWLR